MSKYISGYNPVKAVEKMPFRLSAPESLIPGIGWHMDEYGNSANSFGYDSGIQAGAFALRRFGYRS